MATQSRDSRIPKRVLVVDDEPGIRTLLEEFLTLEGYSTVAVGNGQEAMAALDHQYYDVVLVDLLMPGISGPELVQNIARECPDLPLAIMTGSDTESLGVQVHDIPVSGVIKKPFVMDEVLRVISRLAGAE